MSDTVAPSSTRLTLDDFEAWTHRIGATLRQGQQSGLGLETSYRTAHARHVVAAPHPGLAAFGRLLLQAPYAMRHHHVLDELTQLKQQHELDTVQRRIRRQVRLEVCGYGHTVTIFVNQYRAMVGDRSAFTGWLAGFSGQLHPWTRRQRSYWAGCVVAGSVGEVVGADLLRPFVKAQRPKDPQLRHGTVQQDLWRGTDFTFSRTPRGIRTADIKTGGSCRDQIVVREGAHIILSIAREDIEGFYLRPEAMGRYIQALERTL
jgi:hypothetical protein